MARFVASICLSEVVSHFEVLDDPRPTINRLHPLPGVRTSSLMRVLARVDGPAGIHKWVVLNHVRSWSRSLFSILATFCIRFMRERMAQLHQNPPRSSLKKHFRVANESMWQCFGRFLKEEDAPTMVEYALLIALIAIVAAIGVTVFGSGVSTLFLVPPDYF